MNLFRLEVLLWDCKHLLILTRYICPILVLGEETYLILLWSKKLLFSSFIIDSLLVYAEVDSYLCLYCSTFSASKFPSEVITYEQWVQLKPGPKSMLSGWMKSAFLGGKKETQESAHQNLDFILSTAPIWDRLFTTCSWWVLVYISLFLMYSSSRNLYIECFW